ncbi:hypothetical protein SAMN05216431_11010 [Ligilactobacillus sp. WC1T17]|uniref:XRE family transcriptional regulator n=1 Tax=Ligilactobacillus ruminis TaxID=1623 RepID=A0ABY1ACN2_9LACO|nr:hypothetical protein SAMN05216431_11010 [Ligilactobacillus ruminis]
MDKETLAHEIISYEAKHNMTDTDFSLASHVSVERVHDIKSMRGEASELEETELRKVMGI